MAAAAYSFGPDDARRYPIEDIIFADSNPPTIDLLESRIATAIWRWKFAPVDQRPSIVANSKLASMLEFWFPFSDIARTRRLGTWCDGIPLLIVDQIDRVTFSLSGVGCFPYQLSAFETEWRFKHRRDRTPCSIILRLGSVVPENQQAARPNRLPRRIFDRRPTQNSDWMIAVELTET